MIDIIFFVTSKDQYKKNEKLLHNLKANNTM